MGLRVYAAAAVSLRGSILFVAGGFDGTQDDVTASVQVLENDQDERAVWSTAPELRIARCNHTLAYNARQNIICVFGGSDRANAALDSTECLRLQRSGEIWQPSAPMPEARLAAASTTGSDGELYVVGGRGVSGRSTNSMFAYWPDANNWSELPPMKQRRQGLCAVNINNMIYVTGGYDESANEFLNSVEVYDLSTRTWSARAPMRFVSRTWTACCVVPFMRSCMDRTDIDRRSL